MENAILRKRFLQRVAEDSVLEIFHLLPEYSFFIKDAEGRFIDLNRRGCQYCGVASAAEAVGRTDHDFFPKQRADEYRRDDRRVLDSGQAIINRIESAPEPEGSPRLVMTTKTPLRDRRGRVIGVAGFSRQVERTREQTGDAAAFSRVIARIHANYHENLSTEQLAAEAGLSASQFERRFRRAFGSSPHQYLIRVRVENAARMLVETDDTVSRVAVACGFYDHAHFSRSFRRVMNLTPTAYRAQHVPTAK